MKKPSAVSDALNIARGIARKGYADEGFVDPVDAINQPYVDPMGGVYGGTQDIEAPQWYDKASEVAANQTAPIMTARRIASKLRDPEDQGATSPSFAGMGEAAANIGRGAVEAPQTAWNYIKETSQKPDPSARIGEDVTALGKMMYHGAVEDPAGFIGGAMPVIGNVLAATDISKLKDMAAEARSQGDEATASKLDQLAAMSAASVLLPAGAGVASKASLKAGEKAIGSELARKAVPTSELFDYSRLSEQPKMAQFDLPRVLPPRGVPERVTDLVANKDVRDKMVDVILKGKEMGGANWYNADPLREKFVNQLGTEAGNQAFRKYMDMVAATSPRSDVGTNVRNASYYYGRQMRGEGMPEVGERNPQPYGHMAQRLHQMNAERVAGAGWDPLNNPKPASFVENLVGNQRPVTVDTHAFRLPAILAEDPRFLETAYASSKDAPKQNIQKLVTSGDMSMEDALKTPAYWQAQPKANEYAAMERYYQPIGQELGMSPAQTQASAWVGGGKLTGLASDESKPFLRFFDDRVMKTAKELNMDPKDVLRDFISGKLSLYANGGEVREHHADGEAAGEVYQVAPEEYYRDFISNLKFKEPPESPVTGSRREAVKVPLFEEPPLVAPSMQMKGSMGSFATNTQAGPFSGGALMSGYEGSTPSFGGRFTTALPDDYSATFVRTRPMDIKGGMATTDALSLAKGINQGQSVGLSASKTGPDGLPSYSVQYEKQFEYGRPYNTKGDRKGNVGHAYIDVGNTPKTPEKHIMGGVKFKFAEGGNVKAYPMRPHKDWREHKDYPHTGGKIVHMTPDEFIKKANQLHMDNDDHELVDHFQKHIEDGKQLDPLALYPDGHQDGRHRAHAAKKLGIRKIPVIIWPDGKK